MQPVEQHRLHVLGVLTLPTTRGSCLLVHLTPTFLSPYSPSSFPVPTNLLADPPSKVVASCPLQSPKYHQLFTSTAVLSIPSQWSLSAASWAS